MKRAPYIAIAGNIGAGKSSFVAFLQSRYAIEPVFEPNDSNPFLERFYEDMPRWAFASQMYFLAAKLHIHKDLAESAVPIVQDRTIWEDAEIFARNLAETGVMDGAEYATYQSLYSGIEETLRPPDLLIYLRCPVTVLRRRIRSRGREMESSIPLKYLRSLDGLYERWFTSYDRSPKLVFETDRLDPVTDVVACSKIMDAVEVYFSVNA
ncbi:MAG: deoxyadenosine/deoxycytidine kinase [Bradymonadia bacterium]|jgi:deoxyadenosine/deoxycytidine kinase